jgi:ribosomal protein L18E
MSLTPTDREWLRTASENQLRTELNFAARRNDLEYWKAIAVELMHRRDEGDAGQQKGHRDN